MTNFEKLKNMTPEQIAAEFMIFRPSDACFDDENRNYYALDGSWHRYSQDCFQANVKWLNEEIPKDPQDYIKELEAENKQLRRERDQAVEDLNTLRKRSGWKCEACYYNDHYNRDICTGCEYNNDNNWKWRGVQEENNGQIDI